MEANAAALPVASAKPKWRFGRRISLRTLLLLTIYIGSLQLFLFNNNSWEFVGGGPFLQMSAAGDRALINNNGGLELIQLSNGFQRTKVSLDPALLNNGVVYSWDHSLAAIGSEDEEWRVYDLVHDKFISSLKGVYRAWEFSPDNTKILVWNEQRKSELRQTQTGALEVSLDIASWVPHYLKSGEMIMNVRSPGTNEEFVAVLDKQGKIKRALNDRKYAEWQFVSREDETPMPIILVSTRSGQSYIEKALNVGNGRTKDVSGLFGSSYGKGWQFYGVATSRDRSKLFLFNKKKKVLTILDTQSMDVAEKYEGIADFDERNLETHSQLGFDVITGARLAGENPFKASFDVVPYESNKIFVLKEHCFDILDKATFKVLRSVEIGTSPNYTQRLHWLPSPRLLVIERYAEFLVYRNRRPEQWWGNLYLWKFWLSVAFLSLFVWSILHDRRMLGQAEKMHTIPS